MISRRKFILSTSGTVALAVAAPISTLLQGCTSSGYALNAEVTRDTIVIPLATLPDLNQPYAYVRLYVERYTNPFLLFHRDDGELVALQSTCSHRGCEVKKLRTKLECPCHGSEYDLSGEVRKGPAPEPLERYRVQQFTDRLEILLK